MEIDMLNAGAGDCFFIHYIFEDRGHNIWVDGGIGSTYRKIKRKISEIKDRNEIIDLLVVTHVDADHIRGILRFFSDKSNDFKLVKRVLFNSTSTLASFFSESKNASREVVIPGDSTQCSFNEGITLEKILLELDLLEEKPIMSGDIVELPGAKIKILSPDYNSLLKLNDEWEEEPSIDSVTCSLKNDYDLSFNQLKDNQFQVDNRVVNQASIAFLLEHESKKIVMLADSNPNIVVSALQKLGINEENPLKVDCIKISHHGSRKNTSDDLLRHLISQLYLISSNSRCYPSKETLARIIYKNNKPTFYCNYPKVDILLPGEEGMCKIITTNRVEI